MYDDGLHSDISANDGIYGGVITNTLSTGDCWRLSADISGTLGSQSFRRLSEQSIYITSTPLLGMPTNVSVSTGIWTNQVEITWGAVANAVYYDIQRSSISSVWVNAPLISTTGGTNYFDKSVQPGDVFYYRVRAVNKVFADSEFSSIVVGTTLE